MMRFACLAAVLLGSGALAHLPDARPADVGMDPVRLARIDAAVEQAIAEGRCPGAVVLVARAGKVVWRKAYGLRAQQPRPEPMTTDTVFDLASLTKPIATATAVLLLVERGKLRLDDPVAHHLPAFGANGKGKVTVEQLLLHTSGLIADNSLADYRGGRLKAIQNICDLKLSVEPGARLVYSDVGFIVLGQLVEQVSGEPLEAFTKRNIFDPLALADTGFRPVAARCAPTEKDGDHWLRGVVHDPRARLLGGVAGHCRPVRHGRRPGGLRADAPRRRDLRRADGDEEGNGPPDDGGPAGAGRAARPRLGRAHGVLREPRPALRRVRPHRVHRHLAVDRPAEPNRRRIDQPGPSQRQGRGVSSPARTHRHACRRGDRSPAVSSRPGGRGADRDRRVAAGRSSAAWPDAGRPGNEPHRPGRRR
ncbi:MAG: serine hydrolase domain-containing protein [Gemmataceae bacterium]